MPDQANDELRRDIAEKLRELRRTNFGEAGSDEWIAATWVDALADALQPTKLEFRKGDWVIWRCDWEAEVFQIRSIGTHTLYSKDERLGSGFDDRLCEPLGFDPLEYAALIHEHKPLPGYISTDGLPELPEGWEYTGEYREPVLNEYFWAIPTGGLDQRIVNSWRKGERRLIVRRKKATEQPSPTGDS